MFADCCGRGFCLALGRTIGSACGLRFIGPSTPFGVCPGVRPGVRPGVGSAGEALMTKVVEIGVSSVKVGPDDKDKSSQSWWEAREIGATGAQ